MNQLQEGKTYTQKELFNALGLTQYIWARCKEEWLYHFKRQRSRYLRPFFIFIELYYSIFHYIMTQYGKKAKS